MSKRIVVITGSPRKNGNSFAMTDAFIKAAEEKGHADVVVVFGGTNDFGHGDAPLGSISDRTEHSFCGAFHVLLQKLITRYPEAQLVSE